MARPRLSLLAIQTPPVVKLWLYRILVDLGGHRAFIKRGGLTDDALAEAVGLGDWTDDRASRFVAAEALADLRARARAAESRSRKPAIPKALAANTRRLARLLGLSTGERQVLEFAVLMHVTRVLQEAVDLLGEGSFGTLRRLLATVLRLPESEVGKALDGSGLLARSGLVTVDHRSSPNISMKLDLLSDSMAEQLYDAGTDPLLLLREYVSVAPAPVMTLADYGHIGSALALLRPYLQKAIAARRPGVNVLVHGVPGTGKTQLARVLASLMGAQLFEVASEDGRGDVVDRGVRLRAYRAAQCCFRRRKALIAFDEIEDVFAGEVTFFGSRFPARNKAWMNRVLEDNPVPTLWMSNSIEAMDAAIIRRFDQVIEVPIPPRRQRARLIDASCAGLLDEQGVARLARFETLAPAVVVRAAGVVNLVKDDLVGEAGAALLQLVGSTLRAQGHADADLRRDVPEAAFDPAFLQADVDLEAVLTGIAATRIGRLCLYGPPGTGKSAYARYLADALGMPLHFKRASDLLSKWVGDNEKNVALAFDAARQDGGLLLIDEADSFLTDRRGARQNWEATLTNELLTQMEAFDGVFVASTNLIEGLDPAALRRFDLKARFGFLRSDQAWRLLQVHLQRLGLPEPEAGLRGRLDQLDTLTPGDFAALARRHRFQPLVTAAAWVDALALEATLKAGGKNRIGFLHQ